MQIYDLIVLLIILIAAFMGWRKGLATQVASIVSLVASYLVAVNFRTVLASKIDAPPIFANGAAMLILFLGTSMIIWLIFRQIKGSIEALKLGEFDHQMGGIFGAFKGFLIASLITLFGVSLLGDQVVQETIISSRSGHIITSFLNSAHSIMPAELHESLEPYFHAPLEQLNSTMAQGAPGVNLPRINTSGLPHLPTQSGYQPAPAYSPQTAPPYGYPQSAPTAQPNFRTPPYQSPQYGNAPSNGGYSPAPTYRAPTPGYTAPANTGPTVTPPGNWATPSQPTPPRF